MSPSPNDFSAITELMDIKRLYEEQEEKWKQRVAEKDDLIAQLEADLHEKERLIQSHSAQGQEAEAEVQRMRQEQERVQKEMAGKVAQLNERIKELNQRLLATTGAAATGPQAAPQGFFKR